MNYRPSNSASRLAARQSAEALARGLGWFSIGIGLAELLAPRALARNTGLRGGEALLSGYGLREIATGMGAVIARDPAPWVWGRIAGDALDLATLAAGLGRARRGVGALVALAAVGGVTALDVYCARMLSQNEPAPSVPDYSSRSGLPRSPQEMRGAARDFQTPRDMRTPEPLRPLNAI